jgi:hypothetical protein
VRQVRKGRKVFREKPERQALKVHKEKLDQLEQLDLKDHQEL